MNIEAVLLSVLLVFLSAILKSGITNAGGTAATAWEIGLGLPVDISFVAFSVVLTATTFLPEMEQYREVVAVSVLILAAIQLIFLYKPSKGFYEGKKFLQAFGVFTLNAFLTLVCLSGVLIKVLAL